MIIGYSHEITDRPEIYAKQLPSQLLNDISVIRRNSEHLARLVDDVLILAEADTGSMQLTKETVSIRNLIRESTEAVSGLFERKGLHLTVAISSHVPNLYCDPTRIQQVLLNLLSNAARFTEHGGAQVRAFESNGMLTVTVSDTGAGIEPSNLDRLFQPFQQSAPWVRRQYGGTGLGLAISKRLVEAHGGKIRIGSVVGEGTSVSFELPLGREQAATPWQSSQSPYYEYGARTRSSSAPKAEIEPKLLVVEEESTLSDLLKRTLNGVEVSSVPTFPRSS